MNASITLCKRHRLCETGSDVYLRRVFSVDAVVLDLPRKTEICHFADQRLTDEYVASSQILQDTGRQTEKHKHTVWHTDRERRRHRQAYKGI